jgi:hypothetical protein
LTNVYVERIYVLMDPALKIQDIDEWRQRLRNELSELERQTTPLLAHMRQLKQQLDLLDKLADVTARGASTEPSESGAAGSLPSTPVGQSLTEVVFEILRQAGEPLHISVIREKYLASGHQIPGKGNESNLIAYMVRDPRFARVAKGTYTLASAGVTPPLKRRRKRRRRRRRARPTSGE